MVSRQQIHDLIVTELPVALFVVDAEFTIIEFNPAAEEITGWNVKRCWGADAMQSFLPVSAHTTVLWRRAEKPVRPVRGGRRLSVSGEARSCR